MTRRERLTEVLKIRVTRTMLMRIDAAQDDGRGAFCRDAILRALDAAEKKTARAEKTS